MVKYTLNYFDTAGRGETIRLMFHAAGAEFIDNRMNKEQWAENKSDGKFLNTSPKLSKKHYTLIIIFRYEEIYISRTKIYILSLNVFKTSFAPSLKSSVKGTELTKSSLSSL